MGRTEEDGRKPTAVRIPQEALETLTFKGIHLDKWHEMENEEASKLLDEGEKSILTELLFQDAYRYFNIPKKITADTMSDTGTMAIIGNVLRGATAPIVQYEAFKYNDWRYYTCDGTSAKKNGTKMSQKRIDELASLVETEKGYLLSGQASYYLQGLEPSAVVRYCRQVAIDRVDSAYMTLSKRFRFSLKQKDISEEELAEHLGISLSELGAWFRRLYYDRQVAIKDAVKAIRKARKEKKE